MNVHIQLFPSGLLLIEDFHTELLHTEKLHTELVHTETSHRAATQRETSSQFVYNSWNQLAPFQNACSMERWLVSSGMVNNRLSYFSVVFVERHLRYRDVVWCDYVPSFFHIRGSPKLSWTAYSPLFCFSWHSRLSFKSGWCNGCWRSRRSTCPKSFNLRSPRASVKGLIFLCMPALGAFVTSLALLYTYSFVLLRLINVVCNCRIFRSPFNWNVLSNFPADSVGSKVSNP